MASSCSPACRLAGGNLGRAAQARRGRPACSLRSERMVGRRAPGVPGTGRGCRRRDAHLGREAVPSSPGRGAGRRPPARSSTERGTAGGALPAAWCGDLRSSTNAAAPGEREFWMVAVVPGGLPWRDGGLVSTGGDPELVINLDQDVRTEVPGDGTPSSAARHGARWRRRARTSADETNLTPD